MNKPVLPSHLQRASRPGLAMALGGRLRRGAVHLCHRRRDCCRNIPRLVFNHNEAVLYRWVQEYAPELFRKIQALVAAGSLVHQRRLVPAAGCEPARHRIAHPRIATGGAFFREHFGVEPRVAYNFDSFGHSAGLPQLLRRAGYELYIHMRPQAPDLALPSDLYRWRGLDGSEILRAADCRRALPHGAAQHRAAAGRRRGAGAASSTAMCRCSGASATTAAAPTREDLQRIDDFARREQRVDIVHSTTEQPLRRAAEPRLPGAPVVEGELQRVFTGCYTSLVAAQTPGRQEPGRTGPGRGAARRDLVATRAGVSADRPRRSLARPSVQRLP